MPIYSTNRVNSAVVNEKIAVIGGYNSNDFGRIMQECVVNDMRVFDFVMQRDFTELKGMTESTMTSSELSAFAEVTLKTAWDSIIAQIRKWAGKIKSVIANVRAKLTIQAAKDSASKLKAKLPKVNIDLSKVKLPKFRKPKDSVDYAILKEFQDLADDLCAAAETDEFVMNEAALSFASLKSRAEKIKKDAKGLIDKNFEKANEKITAAHTSIQELRKELSGKSKFIAALDKVLSTIDKCVNRVISTIRKISTDAKKVSSQQFGKAVTLIRDTGTAVVSGFTKLAIFSRKNSQGAATAITAAAGDSAASDYSKAGIAFESADFGFNARENYDDVYLETAFDIGFCAYTEEVEDLTDEELAEEAEALEIKITVNGDSADVEVENNTDGDVEGDEPETDPEV